MYPQPSNTSSGPRDIELATSKRPGLPASRNALHLKIALPRLLEAHDLLAFSLLAIITLSSINSVQFGGPAVYLYWVIGTFTLLLPCVYVSQWLVQRFPGEGGP